MSVNKIVPNTESGHIVLADLVFDKKDVLIRLSTTKESYPLGIVSVWFLNEVLSGCYGYMG